MRSWLQLSAHGAVKNAPFSLRVPEVRVGYEGTLGVSGLEADSLGQQVAVDGSYEKGGAGSVQLNAEGIDLGALGQALGVPQPLHGRAQLHVRARGRLQAPNVELSLRADDVGIADSPRHAFALNTTLDGRAGRATLSANVTSGDRLALSLEAGAELTTQARASWAQKLQSARVDAALEVSRLDGRFVQRWMLANGNANTIANDAAGTAPAEPLWLHSRVDGRVHMSGSFDEPVLEADLRARVRDRQHQRTIELRARPHYASGAGELALLASDPDGRWIEADLSLAHPEHTTSAVLRDAARLLHEAAFEARVDIAPRRISVLPQPAQVPKEQAAITLGGRLTATHVARAEPSAELSLTMQHPPSPHAGEACMGSESQLELNARLHDSHVDAQLVLSRERKALLTLTSSASVELAPALAGNASPAVSAVAADARVEDIELSTLPLLCDQLSGRLSGSLHVEGLVTDAPRIAIDLHAAQLSVHKPYALDANLTAALTSSEGNVDLELLHEGRRSTLSARIPLRVQGTHVEVPADAPWLARLRLDGIPAGALAPEAGPVSHVSGTVSGKLDLTGTRAAPLLLGQVEAKDVGFTATAIAQPLSDIDGRIVFEQKRIVVDHLTAHDVGGTLRMDGTLERDTKDGLSAALQVHADGFPMRQQGRIAGDLDATADIRVSSSPKQTRVSATLKDVSIWLRGGDLRKGIDLAPHPDIVDPRTAALNDEPPSSPESSVPLYLSIDASDSFWVRREDFAVKLSTRLNVSVEAQDVSIKGPAVLQRGYLTLLGQSFAIGEKSRIDFVGSHPPDPVLAIEATTENRRTNQRIAVQISGRTSAPTLQFLIDGRAVSATEAARALFSNPNASGDTAAGQAQSFVGGLTGGILGLSLRRELGGMMPVLVVEPQSAGTSARVRAGFELDSLVPAFLRDTIRGVYVEGVLAGASKDQNRNAEPGVLLELYLPADLVTSGQYGPGQTWSLDLGWEP